MQLQSLTEDELNSLSHDELLDRIRLVTRAWCEFLRPNGISMANTIPMEGFMTAAYRVVTAERKDIAAVTVVCAECGSEVSLVIEKATIPESCPSCSRRYGDKTSEALAGLGRFHRAAAMVEQAEGKPIFRFTIREPI